MRFHIPIVLLAWVAVGCGVAATPVAESSEQTVQPKDVKVPTDAPSTKIGLIRDGKTLLVGDTIEKGMGIFPRAEKANAVTELPEGWPKGYRASGWDNEKEGFAMILQDDRVVGALVSESDVDEKRIKQILSDYQTLIGTAPQVGPATGDTRYWIWEDQPYRCVVCATKNARSQTLVVVGMGYSTVMDALQMSEVGANADILKARRILQNSSTG